MAELRQRYLIWGWAGGRRLSVATGFNHFLKCLILNSFWRHSFLNLFFRSQFAQTHFARKGARINIWACPFGKIVTQSGGTLGGHDVGAGCQQTHVGSTEWEREPSMVFLRQGFRPNYPKRSHRVVSPRKKLCPGSLRNAANLAPLTDLTNTVNCYWVCGNGRK